MVLPDNLTNMTLEFTADNFMALASTFGVQLLTGACLVLFGIILVVWLLTRRKS